MSLYYAKVVGEGTTMPQKTHVEASSIAESKRLIVGAHRQKSDALCSGQWQRQGRQRGVARPQSATAHEREIHQPALDTA